MAEVDRQYSVPSHHRPSPRGVDPGRAGLLAALIMLGAQLIWRLEWSHGVIQAFPELLVAAISRLVPLGAFGTATENYGDSAKQALFIAVLIGILVVGYIAGVLAGRLAGAIDRGFGGRLIASVIVTGVLLLFTLFIVLPVAHLGTFGSYSSYQGGLLTRLVVTFALFAVSWAAIARGESTPAVAVATDEPTLSRRSAVWGGVTVAAAAVVSVVTWRFLNPQNAASSSAATSTATTTAPSIQDIVATQRALQTEQAGPTPTPAAASGEDVASLASDTSAPATSANPTALFAELDKEKRITPILTANNDFYHVSKNLFDPSPSTQGWTLKIEGEVNEPLTLTYDQLVQRATTKEITTLCCISNQIGGDLISTAQWTGIPLVELLKEAGVKSPTVDVKFHSVDDYEDSIPLSRAMNPDTMVVIGMNDVPLPQYHGGPSRLIVPGLYGMKNPKWLQRIELIDNKFNGYWESRGWSQTAVCQIWGRIDFPGDGAHIKRGPAIADGIASAGDRGIKRVEVSFDEGKTWADATLEPALNPPLTWVRWAYEFEAKPGNQDVMIRVTDGKGNVMQQTPTDTLPDGPTGYPENAFRVD